MALKDWKRDKNEYYSWIKKDGKEKAWVAIVDNGYVACKFDFLNPIKLIGKTHLSMKDAIKDVKNYMRTH